MATSEDQLETIVQAVIQRIRAAGSVGQQGELALDDKVISAAALTDRLDGVRRLVVSARAVVTPSARDILKDKNIALVRSLPKAAPGQTRLAITVCGNRIENVLDIANLVASLEQRGIEVDQSVGADVGKMTSEIAKKIGHDGIRGVLLTDQAAVAVCVANRTRGIRAATVESRGEVNELVQNLGANLLIIDAARQGRANVQRMIEVFAAQPPVVCPSNLKPWLE